MGAVCVKQFNLETVIKVAWAADESFIVVRADDRGPEQETLYLLQNKSRMTQIEASLVTLTQQKG